MLLTSKGGNTEFVFFCWGKSICPDARFVAKPEGGIYLPGMREPLDSAGDQLFWRSWVSLEKLDFVCCAWCGGTVTCHLFPYLTEGCIIITMDDNG